MFSVKWLKKHHDLSLAFFDSYQLWGKQRYQYIGIFPSFKDFFSFMGFLLEIIRSDTTQNLPSRVAAAN